MEKNWKYVKPLEDRDSVRAFLKKYRINMPKSMIETLETYNGGRPADKRILTSAKREYVFKTLLSYNENDKETIYGVYPDPFRKAAPGWCRNRNRADTPCRAPYSCPGPFPR